MATMTTMAVVSSGPTIGDSTSRIRAIGVSGGARTSTGSGGGAVRCARGPVVTRTGLASPPLARSICRPSAPTIAGSRPTVELRTIRTLCSMVVT